jgi:hypothetical protein
MDFIDFATPVQIENEDFDSGRIDQYSVLRTGMHQAKMGKKTKAGPSQCGKLAILTTGAGFVRVRAMVQ